MVGPGLTCLQPSHTHGGHGRAEFSTAASELAVAPMLTEEQGHSVAVWEGGNKKKVQAHECARGHFRDGEPGLESKHLKLKDFVHIL